MVFARPPLPFLPSLAPEICVIMYFKLQTDCCSSLGRCAMMTCVVKLFDCDSRATDRTGRGHTSKQAIACLLDGHTQHTVTVIISNELSTQRTVPRLGELHPAGGEPHVFARAIAPGPTGDGRGTAHGLQRLSCDLLRGGHIRPKVGVDAPPGNQCPEKHVALGHKQQGVSQHPPMIL